jgi:chromosome partitioning protein
MVRLVDQIKSSGANPNLEIEGIVMTMYDMRTNLSQQVVQQVCQHFGEKVYETLIPRSVRLSEAPSYGKPINVYDRNCTGAAAYRQLAREFLNRRKQSEGSSEPEPEEIPADVSAIAPSATAEPAPEPTPGS